MKQLQVEAHNDLHAFVAEIKLWTIRNPVPVISKPAVLAEPTTPPTMPTEPAAPTQPKEPTLPKPSKLPAVPEDPSLLPENKAGTIARE